MPKFRDTNTGAIRESDTDLGFPYVPADEADDGDETKAELQDRARALGVATSGTKDEIRDRIADAEAGGAAG